MPELADPHPELALGHADRGKPTLQLIARQPDQGRPAEGLPGDDMKLGALLDRGGVAVRGRAGAAFGNMGPRRRHLKRASSCGERGSI
jgi:hypothetical protein